MKEELHIGSLLTYDLDLLRESTHLEMKGAPKFTIPVGSRMHGFISGLGATGKTKLMNRIASELSEASSPDTGKKVRIVAFDSRGDWNIQAIVNKRESVKRYSMANPEQTQLSLNVWKVPKHVIPQRWVAGIIENFSQFYGLGEKEKTLFKDTVYEVFYEQGIFRLDLTDADHELQKDVCFSKIIDRIAMHYKSMSPDKHLYRMLLDRLAPFDLTCSDMAKYYSEASGLGIGDLLGKDDITVFEGKWMDCATRNFLYASIAFGMYMIEESHESDLKGEEKYETQLFIEEAEQWFFTDTSGKNHSILDAIYENSGRLGINVLCTTQRPSKLSDIVIANSCITFVGRLYTKDDIDTVLKVYGNDDRIVRWLRETPFSCFLYKEMGNEDLALIKLDILEETTPSDRELLQIVS